MREIKLCLAGCGAVARRFCQLLQEKQAELAAQYAVRVIVSGVCSPSRGALLDQHGLELAELLRRAAEPRGFATHPAYRDCDALGLISGSGADIFMELSPLSITDGEPAASYMVAALQQGLHVITANKGPLALQYRRLREAAAAANRLLLYEAIVMDGTPLFNLVRQTLPGNRVLGIRGILNSTSNFVLQQLELGRSYEEAIAEAQRIQLAEADPSLDVDGWDGAAKICALANILMEADLRPEDAEITSIRRVSAAEIAAAQAAGQKLKYLCEARRDTAGKVRLSVQPRQLPLSDVFSCVDGSSAAVCLDTDLAGKITIIQTKAGILQTAYGLYSDLLTILSSIA